MIAWLKNVAVYLICAIAATALARWIESPVAIELVLPNLITMVIALLAINVQTTAVIAVKLRELADKHAIDFSKSIGQFSLALYEQGALVLIALVLSAVSKSAQEIMRTPILECSIFFVLLASLHIFMDTTISLLTCLFPEVKD